MSHTNPETELRHLNRLLRLRVFLRTLAGSTAILGLSMGTLLLSMRLLGLALTPTPWWWLTLLLPLAWALHAVHGKTPASQQQADWLDRNRHLGGLLVTSREVDIGPWRRQLDTALAKSPRQDPNWNVGRPLAALLAPALLWAIILLLPAPEPARTPWESLQAHRLQRFEEELVRLEDSKALDESEIRSLRQRIQELKEKLEEGESLDWEEVDSLDRRLEQSKHDRLVKVQELLDAAKRMVESLGLSEQMDALPPDQQAQAMQALLEKMEESELLAEIPKESFESLQGNPLDSTALQLPPGLAEALGRIDAAGRNQPVGLPVDPKALAALAEELGGACEQAAQALAAEGLPAADLADLDRLLEDYKACLSEGKGKSSATGTAGVGKGGLTEGPGHTRLLYDNETEGDRKALSIHRLPKGRKPSAQWQSLGVSRGAPEIDPLRSTATGSGSAGGTKASYRRRLSPHHREVVRRYFSETRAKQSRPK